MEDIQNYIVGAAILLIGIIMTTVVGFVLISKVGNIDVPCSSGIPVGSQCIICTSPTPNYNTTSGLCYGTAISSTINFNDNRMLLYYSFDSGTNDDSSHGINGINGGTTQITGKIGNARYFNFNNITIPDLAILGLRNHNFTISYWVNKTSGFGDQMSVFTTCKDCLSQTGGYYGLILPNLYLGWDSILVYYFASQDGSTFFAAPYINPMGFIVYDSWEMYTLIGNGTSLRTFQGNVLVDTVTINYNFPLQNGTNFILGFQQPVSFGTQQLIGSIDEFFYLNRSISEAELDCIHNTGLGQSLKLPVDCTGYNVTTSYTITNTTTTSGQTPLSTKNELRKLLFQIIGLAGIVVVIGIITLVVAQLNKTRGE